MKKWLIPLIGLTISLAVGGIVTGFTLGGGSGTPTQDLAEQAQEPTVCNAEHDISTCTQEELYELGLVGPAIMKGPFPFVAPITGGDGGVVTSIDDIDSTVCNPVHNINACTQEELYELGLVGPASMKGPFPFWSP